MLTIYRKNSKFFNYIYLAIIIFFSFSINWKYSKYGVFPIDTFLHYDSAFRILNGEHPVKDFWIVSGFIVDYLQAFFFKMFEINWHAYIFHSSFFNLLISIFTYFLLINVKLEKTFALFYTLCLSLLAYTVSGTPFVDLHATFFCLFAVYSTILAIKKPSSKFYWVLMSICFFLAFLSKQVPTSYMIILYSLIIFPYLIIKKNFIVLRIILFSVVALSLIFVLVLKKLNIDFELFYIQYFDFPSSIGSERALKVSVNLKSLFSHYKFIFVPIIFIIFFKVRMLLSHKVKFYSDDIICSLVILSFAFSLIFHQILTKNQIYIYFLIPLLCAYFHADILQEKFNTKDKFIYLIIFLVIFSTVKYHLRFNENRKFHDLQDVNLNKAIDANFIDKKLNGLRWISPQFKHSPKKEIENINEIIKILKKDTRKKMVLGNYPFLSIIIEEELFSTSRWHVFDGTDYPQEGNHYFNSYKNLFIKKIKDNEIEVIYTILPVNSPQIYNYIEKKCFKKKQIKEFIASHTIKKCDNFN